MILKHSDTQGTSLSPWKSQQPSLPWMISVKRKSKSKKCAIVQHAVPNHEALVCPNTANS